LGVEEFIEEDIPTRNIPKMSPKLQQYRKPISERIQLIQKRPGEQQGQQSINRRHRPIITLDGRKLTLGEVEGGRKKNNIKIIGSKREGVSILQRISF
jgi:hypothetical protein